MRGRGGEEAHGVKGENAFPKAESDTPTVGPKKTRLTHQASGLRTDFSMARWLFRWKVQQIFSSMPRLDSTKVRAFDRHVVTIYLFIFVYTSPTLNLTLLGKIVMPPSRTFNAALSHLTTTYLILTTRNT